MENVTSTVTRLFAAVDKRDWQSVEETMDNKVLLDYTSMAGGNPAWLTPRQITDAWAALLPGFDRTHHEVFDFSTTENDDSSALHFKGKAEHFIGKESWIVEGTYDATLLRKDGRWAISQFKFNLQTQNGNTQLPAIAAERVRSPRL